MKYAVVLATVVATGAFAISPAFSMETACSVEHLSKMTTMGGTMPEGSQKGMMNKHLKMLNTAMAKDGMRGCETMMRNRHRHHVHVQKYGHTHGTRQGHAHDMKHGKAGNGDYVYGKVHYRLKSTK